MLQSASTRAAQETYFLVLSVYKRPFYKNREDFLLRVTLGGKHGNRWWNKFTPFSFLTADLWSVFAQVPKLFLSYPMHWKTLDSTELSKLCVCDPTLLLLKQTIYLSHTVFSSFFFFFFCHYFTNSLAMLPCQTGCVNELKQLKCYHILSSNSNHSKLLHQMASFTCTTIHGWTKSAKPYSHKNYTELHQLLVWPYFLYFDLSCGMS